MTVLKPLQQGFLDKWPAMVTGADIKNADNSKEKAIEKARKAKKTVSESIYSTTNETYLCF